MDILGIRIDDVTMEEALEKAFSVIKNRNGFSYVFTPNAEICMAALKDEKLLAALNSSFMNIPDGEGVLKAAAYLSTPLREKVPGCEFTLNMLSSGVKLSVYLFGATEASVAAAKKNITEKYASVTVVGIRDGYFKDSEVDGIIDDINKSHCDLLLVGLGAPKGEMFIYDNRDKLDVALAVGVGGTIDIISGFAKRAPKFFLLHKLEWFYRLICQPKRFKRMLNIPKFLVLCKKHALHNKSDIKS